MGTQHIRCKDGGNTIEYIDIEWWNHNSVAEMVVETHILDTGMVGTQRSRCSEVGNTAN
jgi:hypothetical protein